jgi:hypothetical protein
MKQSFIKFDIFRKMPKDLTEPTFCGALGKNKQIDLKLIIFIVSFICTVLMVSLCLTETSKYLSVETRSDMLVDITHHDDRLNINVDIVFPRMPCEVLSLDI